MDSLVKTKDKTKAPNLADPKKFDHAFIKEVKGCESIDEVEALLELEFDNYHETPPSRQQVRELYAFAHQEHLEDQVAPTPTSVEPLSRKIDANLNNMIDMLSQENYTLNKIVESGKEYIVPNTDIIIDVDEAKKMLKANNRYLLDIKKELNDQRKTEQGAGNPNTALNINMDLGSIVGNALENIKNAEAITI